MLIGYDAGTVISFSSRLPSTRCSAAPSTGRSVTTPRLAERPQRCLAVQSTARDKSGRTSFRARAIHGPPVLGPLVAWTSTTCVRTSRWRRRVTEVHLTRAYRSICSALHLRKAAPIGSRVRVRRSAEHRRVEQVDASALERGSIGCGLFVGSHRGRPEFRLIPIRIGGLFARRGRPFCCGRHSVSHSASIPTGKQEKKSPEILGQMVGVAGTVAVGLTAAKALLPNPQRSSRTNRDGPPKERAGHPDGRDGHPDRLAR